MNNNIVGPPEVLHADADYRRLLRAHGFSPSRITQKLEASFQHLNFKHADHAGGGMFDAERRRQQKMGNDALIGVSRHAQEADRERLLEEYTKDPGMLARRQLQAYMPGGGPGGMMGPGGMGMGPGGGLHLRF